MRALAMRCCGHVARHADTSSEGGGPLPAGCHTNRVTQRSPMPPSTGTGPIPFARSVSSRVRWITSPNSQMCRGWLLHPLQHRLLRHTPVITDAGCSPTATRRRLRALGRRSRRVEVEHDEDPNERPGTRPRRERRSRRQSELVCTMILRATTLPASRSRSTRPARAARAIVRKVNRCLRST